MILHKPGILIVAPTTATIPASKNILPLPGFLIVAGREKQLSLYSRPTPGLRAN
jgi:hypothetical protein